MDQGKRQSELILVLSLILRPSPKPLSVVTEKKKRRGDVEAGRRKGNKKQCNIPKNMYFYMESKASKKNRDLSI